MDLSITSSKSSKPRGLPRKEHTEGPWAKGQSTKKVDSKRATTKSVSLGVWGFVGYGDMVPGDSVDTRWVATDSSMYIWSPMWTAKIQAIFLPQIDHLETVRSPVSDRLTQDMPDPKHLTMEPWHGGHHSLRHIQLPIPPPVASRTTLSGQRVLSNMV